MYDLTIENLCVWYSVTTFISLLDWLQEHSLVGTTVTTLKVDSMEICDVFVISYLFSFPALHKGYTEDDSISVGDRRQMFKKRGSTNKGHSLDDTAIDSTSTGMKSASSESHLEAEKLALMVPEPKRSGSRLSLIGDKLADTARAFIGESTGGGGAAIKKSKSPFTTIFKKNKSRDPSPNDNARTRSTEYHSLDRKKSSSFRHNRKKPHELKTQTLPLNRNMHSTDDLIGTNGPVINIEAPRGIIPYEFRDAIGRRNMEFTTGSEGSELDQSDLDYYEMAAMAESIDEYHYAVRIFPGQDPQQVFVGWVTPGFHFSPKAFDTKKVRHVVVSTLDVDYKIKQR